MRLELQEVGLQFSSIWQEGGLTSEYGFAVFMIVVDTCLYILVAILYRHWSHGGLFIHSPH